MPIRRSLLCLLTALALALPVSAVAAAPPLVSVTQTSADLHQALARLPSLRFAAGPGARRTGLPLIRIDPRIAYQRFIGAGAAMTDSAAWLIEDELPAAARAAVLDRLFGSGASDIHLSLLRIGVGATDFDVDGTPYTYDDLPVGQTDPTLARFSVAHDEAYLLPAMRAARALDRQLYVEALPWSPPAWMKANDALDNVDSAGTLLPADDGVYARYLVRFLQAYRAAGVPVSALAVQNEPTEYTLGPGLQMSEPTEVAFAQRWLAPALARAGLRQPLLGWDLSWGPLGASDPLVRATRPASLARATRSARGTRSTPALGGLAWHCYFGSPDDMDRVYALSPDALQLVDECGTSTGDPWSSGELEIAALRHWANGVAFWNLALDPSGGPVVEPNIGCQGCTGIVTVDPATGTYTLSGDYDALGQLTRFVSPGARRIESNTFASMHLDHAYQTVVSGLDDVAMRNRDGSIVLLAHDNSRRPVRFQVQYGGGYVTDTLPAGATATLRWR